MPSVAKNVQLFDKAAPEAGALDKSLNLMNKAAQATASKNKQTKIH